MWFGRVRDSGGIDERFTGDSYQGIRSRSAVCEGKALVLKRPENLTDAQHERLAELVAAICARCRA